MVNGGDHEGDGRGAWARVLGREANRVANREAGTAQTCELCEAARMTAWHHEDNVCWVADCDACAAPMVVWRRHGTHPSAADRAHMLDRLIEVAERLGLGEPFVDETRRTIPEHWHAHARSGWDSA